LSTELKNTQNDILVLPSSKNSNAEKSHILIFFQICFKWYGKRDRPLATIVLSLSIPWFLVELFSGSPVAGQVPFQRLFFAFSLVAKPQNRVAEAQK
jgi:hypothetical protein